MKMGLPARKLIRSDTSDEYIGGVCGGIAKYLQVDPTVVRLVTLVGTIITGVFPIAIADVIAWAIVPSESHSPGGF